MSMSPPANRSPPLRCCTPAGEQRQDIYDVTGFATPGSPVVGRWWMCCDAVAMSTPLEDYALLSDLRTGPLVSRDGSIDWLCVPRFDSAAVFCALLGEPDDGRWRLSAVDGEVIDRHYRPDTFVLDTIWQTPTGRVRVTDLLPPRTTQADLIRRVECLEGHVEVEHDLRIRFDYARATPWLRRAEDGHGAPVWLSLAGPDGLMVSGPLLHRASADQVGEREPEASPRLVGRFALSAGERLDWVFTWFPSHQGLPVAANPDAAEAATVRFWTEWADQISPQECHPLVRRSLLVLRALTDASTGGIVAAPTTSLPEQFGGSRNWDYRYTWLRDAAFTMEVMLAHGFTRGATLWRNWLLRAVAGDAHNVKIMYGLAGEREPARVRARPPARLRRFPPSPYRQWCRRPVPGRRRRGGDDRSCRSPGRRRAGGPVRVGSAEEPVAVLRGQPRPSRPWHLGDAR